MLFRSFKDSTDKTELATKHVRYVNSLTPNAAKPRIPPPPPDAASLGLYLGFFEDDTDSPARARALPSGSTTKEPVKTHLSPALHRSTISFRKITSIDLGIDPGGIWFADSWTRNFCQSTNSDLVTSSANLIGDLFLHLGLRHNVGRVKW